MIFSRVCLCVSDRHFYPSTSTDFDETWSQGPCCDLVWSTSAAEGPCDAFLKISKNSQKSRNSNFKTLVHYFLRLCLLCIVKKLTRFKQNWWRRYILKSVPIAIMQVWTWHPRPMLCAHRCLAASTNVLRRACSTADDPICCRQGMTGTLQQVRSKTLHWACS